MLDSHWGVDPVQKKFFMRQAQYRNTMYKLLEGGGSAVIAENMYSFKLTNLVKTPEDMTNLVRLRIFKPTLENQQENYVIPQIVGVNRKDQLCSIISYAPILKAFNGKVIGLLDALMKVLSGKGHDLIGLISGSRGGDKGALGIIAAHLINEKETLRRTFAYENGGLVELDMPLEQYEKVFEKTFDSDIFVDEDVWKDQNAPK
jgi:hypothetical protein